MKKAQNRPILFGLCMIFVLGLVFMLVPLSTAEAETKTKRPNILLLVGDDIGFGDLGISGSVTKTPNLDRLAKQGTMFTNFHVAPVCSVSRSMMLTGNDPIEIGLPSFDYSIYPPARGKPGYEGISHAQQQRLPRSFRTPATTPVRWVSGIWVDPAMVVMARKSGGLIAAGV